MEKQLPNFIIAGVEKTGSTSLYHYVNQHPEVYMCTPKEPDFFLREDFEDRLDTYRHLFREARSFEALGEASVSYFHNPKTAIRIDQILPGAKIIVVLRHPAERAYSHYNMLLDRGVVPKRPYHRVIKEAIHEASFYNTGLPTSKYSRSLNIYQSTFKDRLMVIIYSEYKSKPIHTMIKIFRHIGVDDSFTPETSRNLNVTRRPRYPFLNKLIWQKSTLKKLFKYIAPNTITGPIRNLIRNTNNEPIPPLSPEARTLIIDHLIDDIEQTESLLDRDLSHWKK